MIVFTLDSEDYTFDDNKLSIEEALVIEGATGMGVRGFLIGITMASAKALQCMVWLTKTRSGEAVRLEDVSFDCVELLAGLRREEPTGDASDPTAGQEPTTGSGTGTTRDADEPNTSESSPTT